MKILRIAVVLLALVALVYWQQVSTPRVSDAPADTRTSGAPADAPPPAARADLPAPRPFPPSPVLPSSAPATPVDSGPERSPALPAFLPPEARHTLALIAGGGPFPHRQDGGLFQNRERRLPEQPRGYYREYTVRTPGESDRGARRIVTGGDPPREYWYTDDHYGSFRRFEVPR